MLRISTETQKTIMYIPFINVSNLFIWLLNSFSLKIPYNGVPQTFWIMMKNSVPLVAAQIIISNFSIVAGNIVGAISGYLIPLLISRDLIKLQEQFVDKNA